MPALQGERIGARVTELLFSYLNQESDGAILEARSELKQRWALVSRYKDTKPLAVVRDELSYDMFGTFLETERGRLSGADVLRMLNVEPIYAESEYQTIIELCAKLNRDTIQRMLEVADALAVDWWRVDEVSRMQPSARAVAVLQRRKGRGDYWLKDAPQELLHAWKINHLHMKIRFEDMPVVCAFLCVSPHWLMRMPRGASFYCREDSAVDEILDLYSFMPKRDKPVFIKLLRDISIGGI